MAGQAPWFEVLAQEGFDVDQLIGGGLSLVYRKEGIAIHVTPSEWSPWENVDALGKVLARKLDAARADKKLMAEKERREKLGEHEARRAAFYEAEASAVDRDKTFRPEEPNIRVYGRAIVAVLREAGEGLSAQDFARLCGLVRDELAIISTPPVPKKTTP
jgi:hypothetical protein